jgi:hypothetical protein
VPYSNCFPDDLPHKTKNPPRRVAGGSSGF